MKQNILYAVLCLLTAATPGFSQASQKIDRMLTMGLGLQTYDLGGLCNGASFELGFTEHISAGGFFDYALYGTKVGNRQWKAQFINVGVRGSYHLADILAIQSGKFDPYAGVSVGTRSSQHRDKSDQVGQFKPRPKGVFPGVHVGGFYHFSKKIGGFAEMGWGIAAIRLGLTGRF